MPSILECGLVTIRVIIGVSSAYREICASNMDCFMPDTEAVALIDTGAQTSIVDVSVIEHLRIREKDYTHVRGFNGTSREYPVYDVWLKVINREGVALIDKPDLRVIGADLSHDHYTALIGMDVLQTFTLKFMHAMGMAEMHATVHPPAEGI